MIKTRDVVIEKLNMRNVPSHLLLKPFSFLEGLRVQETLQFFSRWFNEYGIILEYLVHAVRLQMLFWLISVILTA